MNEMKLGDEQEKWQSNFEIKSVWSKAGIGSCTILKSKKSKMEFIFDLGCTPNFHKTLSSAGISGSYIFITHGHLDHIGGIATHFQICLMRLNKGNEKNFPKYFVPMAILEKARQVLHSMSELHHLYPSAKTKEMIEESILGVNGGDEIELDKKLCKGEQYFVRVFTVSHTVPAVGYSIIQEHTRKSQLKSEYKTLSQQEQNELEKAKVKIWEDPVTETTVEIAYTSDTNKSGLSLVSKDILRPNFNSSQNDNVDIRNECYKHEAITKSKILFCEATFLEKSMSEVAIARGHLELHDLNEIFQSHEMKSDNDRKLVLFHVSQRYQPASKIIDLMRDSLKEVIYLFGDVQVATESFLDDMEEHIRQSLTSYGCSSLLV